MKTLEYRTVGGLREVVEIDAHQVGPGQPLLKVTTAGLCRSDEFVMGLKK